MRTLSTLDQEYSVAPDQNTHHRGAHRQKAGLRLPTTSGRFNCVKGDGTEKSDNVMPEKAGTEAHTSSGQEQPEPPHDQINPGHSARRRRPSSKEKIKRARGSHDNPAEPTKSPPWAGHTMNLLQRGGGIGVIVCIFIGPLLAGSYYEPWRWPLIYTSAAAALALFISGFRPGRMSRSGLVLAILLLCPALQGIWMYYNAWGEFSQNLYYDPTYLPWRITELENQPFPSLPGTADKAEAIDRLSYILPCLGLVWGVRKIIICRPHWCQHLAKAIFWAGVCVAIIGLLQRATGSTAILWLPDLEQGLLRKHFFATYRSPGIASCFLNVALAMGMACNLNAMRLEETNHRKKSWRARNPMAYLLATTGGVVILICAVITAGSKAGMALAVITIMLFCFLNRGAISKALRETTPQMFFGSRPVERNLFIGSIVSITVFLLLSFAGTMSERWTAAHKLNYSSLNGRIQANRIMLNMVEDEGWGAMGMGPGSFYPLFPYYTGQYTQKADTMIMGVWAYAHNDYLQTLVEWGWLGTLCLAGCIGGGFLLLARELLLHRQHHSKNRFIHYRSFFLAMAIFLAHAVIEFPFQIESLAVVFSVLTGVAWASSSLRGKDIRSRPNKPMSRRYRTRHQGNHLSHHH